VETQAYFDNIQSEIHRRLTAAEREIDLAVAWLTDRVLFDVLCQKATSGVKVRLLLFDDDINKHLTINRLETSGGRVFRIAEKLMHNKFCVIDRETVISGSYNWTNKAAQDKNYENITITTGDPFFASQFVQEISRIVEIHFGEKQDTPTDFAQIVKRLTLIRQLIELGDTDDLPPQYRKLKTLQLPNEIAAVLSLLDAQRYGDAVAQITDFIARFRQLTPFVDPEIAALQLEIHALELDISHLENEKAGIEKTIQDFDIQYNRALGQLLMQILAQRRQIAAHQAAQNPQDPEAQDRHKDTENDYAQYHKNYEAAAAKTLNALTDNEQRLLKKRFREATKLCYPTVVAEPFKEAATALFIELRQAYAENNLARVTEIADYLQHGKPYHPQHTVGGEKHHIRAVIDRLRSRRAQLRAALQALQTHDTFNTLQHINDWNTYFDNQKAALQARLDKLNEEWTRINK
jgi:HKD family nuclease